MQKLWDAYKPADTMLFAPSQTPRSRAPNYFFVWMKAKIKQRFILDEYERYYKSPRLWQAINHKLPYS
jgi:hypothetical protein